MQYINPYAFSTYKFIITSKYVTVHDIMHCMIHYYHIVFILTVLPSGPRRVFYQWDEENEQVVSVCDAT